VTLPRLYAIVDADVAARHGWTAPDLARAFVAGGARLLQLRAKSLGSGGLLALADDIVPIAHAAGARLVVNDRADVARLSGADGVHVGQDDLSPADARRVLTHGIVGLSTHTEEQIARAIAAPVDYIAVGPVFGTPTKDTGYAPVGLQLVAKAAAVAGLPVVAIGGITFEQAPGVIRAGAASVAVIGGLLDTGDPERRTRALVERLDAC
jgi:thiamine-phosphate pyrophosphorylase